eukprot:Gb_17515 [translate_table: standard]
MSSITLGDDTPAIVSGRGFVEVEGGTLKNVLSIPSLSTNLLLVYQITHLGESMRVQFSPDLVKIRMLHNDTTIVVGKAYHQFRLYTFSHFAPDTYPKSLDLLGSDHDFDSSDSTLGHSLKDEDSPPDSPTVGSLWAR